jgi:hypothetical protein
MKEDLADTIVCFAICLLILIVAAIVLGIGCSMGEDNLIQKLCSQQQYDFCEVIEQKPEYKLKELKQDE